MRNGITVDLTGHGDLICIVDMQNTTAWFARLPHLATGHGCGRVDRWPCQRQPGFSTTKRI